MVKGDVVRLADALLSEIQFTAEPGLLHALGEVIEKAEVDDFEAAPGLYGLCPDEREPFQHLVQRAMEVAGFR